MCFLPCASRQGRPFWPPAGDHEGRPYGAFAPIRKDWEARMAYHILLVDDAPELRRMVGELLEGAGYAVTLAADCAQARRAWTESQPDAALLDVMLPDGDGFSLLEELRRVGNGVPVLFLSARDEDEARLRGLALLGVLGLTALVLGRQFRREQQERDFARSDWINGISHDIRTPLSMVMGYAGQLEADPVLPPRRRAQAAIIRRQSQTIRDLINDLNLTMRLDYAMQPLRRGSLHPAALVRQVAADVLNGGLEERYALAVEVPPEAEALTLEGDASLLRRALLNLVNNCVRHNPEGCSITLTAAAEGEVCTLRVEDDGGGGLPVGLAEVGLAPDGGAAHGTGLRLVEQIARAHGGALELHRAARGVLAVLRLPL